MPIDWFTVAAQVLNFVVLVWLMKRYLYAPILEAIDARERRIAEKLGAAGREEDAAREEREALSSERDALVAGRAAARARAEQEAATERERLLGEGRKAAEEASRARKGALERELDDLRRDLVRRTREEVFAIAQKALGDLSTTSLESQAIVVFTARLRALPADEKESLRGALSDPSARAVVRSAFELPAAQRSAVEAVLRELAPDAPAPRFEVAPDRVCGVELVAGGRKIAWNIASYLASLERSVEEVVRPSRGAGRAPEAAAEEAS